MLYSGLGIIVNGWSAPASVIAEVKNAMQVQVNGESMELYEGATVAALVEKMALMGKRLAVEVNEDIVPRSQHEQFVLSSGDRIEVVHAIGGG